ncbi:hypothetical protein KP004_11405 [Geomonas oryzisoli]|uniref:Phenylacetate--CoA ligase family protein n=1 Tax=Geomonas oryzisoli TaxID=2847992 RepID=A0ABX8J577_9BACT|nr:hypothetical protein [Geomonas oryzisoli]QWV91839.1 hypothetical protein KP004_11405 [Geomonas oryzisoli]
MSFARLYDKLPYPLQSVAFDAYCRRLYSKRYGDRFEEASRALEAFERLPRADMVGYQEEKLRELVRHCYQTVPYYRRIMEQMKLVPADFRSMADLVKLPILTKADVRKFGNEMISSAFTEKDLVHGHTSGTTGTPLDFFWDRDAWFLNNVFDWRQKRWGGMRQGEPYALLLGRTIVSPRRQTPPFWQFNKHENQLWVSSFHLSRRFLPAISEKLAAFRPAFLEGYPSTLFVLAKLLDEAGLTLKVRAVFTSSEPLLAAQRALLERVFSCEVFDYYGQAERVIWGTECGEHNGKHANPDYGITEVVDAAGVPVPAGTTGRLIGTSLVNMGMPFLRYQVGDISSLNESQCACGSAMPLLGEIQTKQEDIIITPSGRYVSASVLTHPFKPLKNVLMSQLVQQSSSELLVKIVKGGKYEDGDTRQLLSGLDERLGGEMTIRVEFVEDIEREPSGKFKWVKCYRGSGMTLDQSKPQD